jgi:hypothetical protein
MRNNPVSFNDPLGDTTIVNKMGNIIKQYGADQLVFLQQGKKLKAIGAIGKKIDISDILPNILENNRGLASFFKTYGGKFAEDLWVSKVAPEQDWDYKNNENTIFGVAWTYDLKQDKKGIKDKTAFTTNGSLNFEDAAGFGNYNAGYTGVYAGIDRLEQYKWAGMGEILKPYNMMHYNEWKNRVYEWQNNIPPYGDQPKDYQYNTKGMNDAAKEIKGSN